MTLKLEGNAKFLWSPGPATGSVTWDGGLKLELNIDVLSGHH